ncbi:MAG: carbohydrate ABC transporter permease [Chloroflexi bacterium]|nr:carbohydrate ABC transporter permease [Chloroflexota bacterium]
MSTYRIGIFLRNLLLYITLTFFAFAMLFPFLVMVFTSLKEASDSYRFPPKLLPRAPITMAVEGYDEELPLYFVDFEGSQEEFVLVEKTVKVGEYAAPDQLDMTYIRELELVTETSGATTIYEDEEVPLYDITVDGEVVPMVRVDRTALGRFANPDDLSVTILQNLRSSEPVERLTWHPENYTEVVNLHGMDRALTNTALVTILVVLGQLVTSVLGGYAFARLKFPGRDSLFVIYLGTIMIPFVVVITPLYKLMILIGWVDKLAALIIPWIFTAYGTFLMRQFFITFPKEIEEAAVLDGASRLQILWTIFLPASTPALATLSTFTFLYAWNSFFWPLVVINTGNEANRVLTLAVSVLGGRAMDAPNLVLAGAAIAVLPPVIIYIFGQRYFVESSSSSGLKG